MYLKEILLFGVLTSLSLTVFLFLYSSIELQEQHKPFTPYRDVRRQHLPQLRGSLLTYRPLDTQSNLTIHFNSSSLRQHKLYHDTLELERLAPVRIQYFTCADDSNALAVLNDNYCDCADGSDENMTSACSNVVVQTRVFHCHSQEAYHFYPTEIYPSRVNDGVCDCADGSDEYDSPRTMCRDHIKMRNLFLSF
jgi:hypothetical protein